MRVVPELSMFIVACEIDGSDLARERERHFRTGKRADNLHGHDSISTSAIGVVVLRYKFRTSFRLFLVAIKMPGICINCALMNGIMPFGMISKLISSISRYLILFDITATFLLDSRKEIQTRSLASDPRFQDSVCF